MKTTEYVREMLSGTLRARRLDHGVYGQVPPERF
jgi:hypothetical protein